MGDFERPNSEQLIDLHVYIVPPDLWRTHLRSAVNQIIDETISAGFIRVHPEASINALRKELEIQLENDNNDYPMPDEYVFLKCVGRCLTQVKPRQEYTLKVKNFQLPTTFAAEIYILDSVAAGVRFMPYSGSSQSSSVRYNGTPRSDRSEFSGHKPVPPIRRSNISTQTNGPGLSQDEQRKLEEQLRRKRQEEDEAERRRREWEEEQERKRREEEKRLAGTDGEDDDDDDDDDDRRRQEEERKQEEERRKREEEERKRREEAERRRQEEERRRKEEEERRRREEEERKNKKRTLGGRTLSELRDELEQVRQERIEAERRREELVKKARFLQNKAQQRRNQARDLWKKKYFEEKKKTAPLEEQSTKLRSELELLHHRIMAQLANSKDVVTRPSDNRPSQQSTNNLRMQAARLQHDIDDTQRRIENVKMKLTTEMKLKNQAEGELKALRAELTQKKINMTLARSVTYTPVPMLTPRS